MDKESFIETDICKVIEQFLNELKHSKQLKIDNEVLQNENKSMRHELDEYETKINEINKELNEKNKLLRSILENTGNISNKIRETLPPEDTYNSNNTDDSNDRGIKLDANVHLRPGGLGEVRDVPAEVTADGWPEGDGYLSSESSDYLDYHNMSSKAQKRFKKNKKKKNRGRSW
jgi:hypothetical protein